ncbi:hypothetical protein ACP4OV_009690 [Aristida adscensionis]
MEALAARPSAPSPPAIAGDASPSPRPRLRAVAVLPRPRGRPSALVAAPAGRTRAPPPRRRRGGGRLLAGGGEDASPDPEYDGAGGQAENNVTLHESHDTDTTRHDEIGISGGGSRSGLFRTPISGGVHTATAVHDLPPPALAVRNLMEQARFAHLCTVMSRMHHRREGYPFGSLVDFAPDPIGHPIFSLSPLAIHTRNLLADPRCTLVVQIPGWSGLSNARVTIFGDVVPLPADQQWVKTLIVTCECCSSDIYFIGGFGTVAWIDVEDYEALQPDKIAIDGGEQNLKELNAMFSKPLKELLSTEGEVDDVALISMDSKGIDIRVRQGAQFNVQRIAYEVDRSVETLEQAKEALRRIINKSRWHTKSSTLRRP